MTTGLKTRIAWKDSGRKRAGQVPFQYEVEKLVK